MVPPVVLRGRSLCYHLHINDHENKFATVESIARPPSNVKVSYKDRDIHIRLVFWKL